VSRFDPYAVLGVPRDATAKQVEDAYRRKAKAAHPDAGGTEEGFHALKLARDTLADPELRRLYDETGEAPGKQPAEEYPDAVAIDHIARVMGLVLKESDTDPHTRPMLDLMGKLLQAEINEGQKVKAKLDKLKGRAEKILGRFNRRQADSATPNILERTALHQVHALNRSLSEVEAQLKPMLRAKDILAEYEFMPEKLDAALKETMAHIPVEWLR
jgi:curved DNA-binding protein CbpA